MLNILMAIVDYIPVGMFLAASIILQKSLYNKMSKGTFALFSSGTIFVFVAGFLKATHKLLYYASVCDFTPLEESFFPMQTIGFVLAAVGMVMMFMSKSGEYKEFAFVLPVLAFIAPAPYKGTMIFVVLMVLGVLVLDGSLFRIAMHQKATMACILIVVAFIFTLCMGYLASNESIDDWIKEIVNTIGQGSLLMAVIMMKNKGLQDKDSLKGIIK